MTEKEKGPFEAPVGCEHIIRDIKYSPVYIFGVGGGGWLCCCDGGAGRVMGISVSRLVCLLVNTDSGFFMVELGERRLSVDNEDLRSGLQ